MSESYLSKLSVGPLRSTLSGMLLVVLALAMAGDAAALETGSLPLLQLSQVATSASQAAEIVRRNYGGQIISVSERVINDVVYYQVKTLLPGGRMKVVRIKAASATNS